MGKVWSLDFLGSCCACSKYLFLRFKFLPECKIYEYIYIYICVYGVVAVLAGKSLDLLFVVPVDGNLPDSDIVTTVTFMEHPGQNPTCPQQATLLA